MKIGEKNFVGKVKSMQGGIVLVEVVHNGIKREIPSYISGKMRKRNRIWIKVGNLVRIALTRGSTQGRIIYRLDHAADQQQS